MIKRSVTEREFADDVAAAVRGLQQAVSEVFYSQGLRLDEPMRFAKRLGLDKSTASKVAKFARCEDPALAALYMPGSDGLNLMVRAARAAGVADELLSRLEHRVQQWRRAVAVHAPDRATLDIMLAGLAAKQDPAVLENQRKHLYLGASALWGVQTRSILRCAFTAPSDNQAALDVATLRCLLGFRRMRSNVPWILSHTSLSESRTGQPIGLEPQPLDPSGLAGGGVPLVPRFCSHPLPQVRRVPGTGSFVWDILAPGVCGETGALDCVMGEYVRGIRGHGTEGDPVARHAQRIRTPAEWLTFDVFVHHSLTTARSARAVLYSELQAESPCPAGPDDPTWLPLYEPLRDLGSGPIFPPPPECPNYSGMIDFVLDRMGWHADEFRLMRLRMKYPPIATVLAIEWPLPQRTD